MPVRNFRSQQLKSEQICNAVLEVATVAQEDCVRVCMCVLKGVEVLCTNLTAVQCLPAIQQLRQAVHGVVQQAHCTRCIPD